MGGDVTVDLLVGIKIFRLILVKYQILVWSKMWEICIQSSKSLSLIKNLKLVVDFELRFLLTKFDTFSIQNFTKKRAVFSSCFETTN